MCWKEDVSLRLLSPSVGEPANRTCKSNHSCHLLPRSTPPLPPAWAMTLAGLRVLTLALLHTFLGIRQDDLWRPYIWSISHVQNLQWLPTKLRLKPCIACMGHKSLGQRACPLIWFRPFYTPSHYPPSVTLASFAFSHTHVVPVWKCPFSLR